MSGQVGRLWEDMVSIRWTLELHRKVALRKLVDAGAALYALADGDDEFAVAARREWLAAVAVADVSERRCPHPAISGNDDAPAEPRGISA